MLSLFQYQTFSIANFAVYESEWFYCDPFTECGYALKDDGKYNLTLEDSKQTLNFPIVKNAYFKHSTASDSIIIQAYIQEDLVVSYGAPKEIILQYDIKNDISKIDIKLYLQNKTATKLPEVGFLSFNPFEALNPSNWNVKKLVSMEL